MKFLGSIVAAIIAFILVYLLNNPINVGAKNIPALGKLLNPFTGFLQNAEADLPSLDTQINLPQLSAGVSVQYDQRLVPHIFAQNILDAVRVQGYLTAQNRLWQMEFITHAAAGRVSEILGKGNNEAYLNFDKLQRRIGMVYGAENTLKAWKDDTESYQILEAYTNGVNAYIKDLQAKNFPIEYKLIGYAPEEWTVLKTALLLKYMSNSLSGKSEDVLKTNTRSHLGNELFNQLYPSFFDRQSPIIPDTIFNFTHKDSLISTQTAAMNKVDTQFFNPNPDGQVPKNIGSNNWAVSAQKTANGKPILCNDPHLILNLPSIWYELQIHTPEANVYGVSLPGAPGIIIGFNENISWGVTNVAWDVKDWFTVDFTDANKMNYRYDNQILPVDLKIETFKLKGEETVFDTVRYTRWGPVVYDNPNEINGGMALKWLAHSPSNDSKTFLNLNKAKNYDEYQKALTYYACPAQNFVFASKQNDIALWVAGNLPNRQKDEGRFVQNGALASSNWKGFIPFEHQPHSKNPAQGFIGSANQHSTHPSYPYNYVGYFEEYRGRYLNRTLANLNQIKTQDMMNLQMDNYSVKAEDYVPVLLALLKEDNLSTEGKKYLSILKKWDFKFEKDAQAASLFEIWCNILTQNVWQDDLPTGASNIDFNGINNPDITMVFPEENTLREFLEFQPNHLVFDNKNTPNVSETAADMVQISFEQAVENLENKAQTDWRNVKNTTISHLARLDAFSRKNLNIGGHGSALNACTDNAGPSWRMVVEMGNPIKAWGVYPGGQSGNPGSKFYDNMLDKWANGEYYELFFMQNKTDNQQELLFTQEFK